MASADFSRLTIFDCTVSTSAESPRVRQLSFLFYSPDLLYKVTHIYLDFNLNWSLILYRAFVSDFCSSSQDFIPRFLQPHLTVSTLRFLNGWSMCTPIVDFHHLDSCHAWHTNKKNLNK